jgi:ketosteroid isomerase-like protein
LRLEDAMRIREQTCRARLSLGSAAAALALLLAATTGCGEPTSATTSGGSGPQATPSVNAPSATAAAERLVGSDSVAVTRQVLLAHRAALKKATVATLARIYADDVVFDDYCYGTHGEGQAVAVGMIRKNLAEYTDARWLAGYAGCGVAVIEEYWDFTETYGAKVAILAVFETRGGRVIHEGDYLQAFQNLPGGRALEPEPLKSAPRPADTAAAAEDVALRYSAALQAKDAAAMAALSAPEVAFMDTASSTVGSDLQGVQAHYAAIFRKPGDLAFTNVRYAIGRGWAAVLWTAASTSFGFGADGVTMLEIRDGKIARETLYYNSAKVPFSAPDV